MFTILLSETLLDEILATVSDKPHLSDRIPVEQLQSFLVLLRQSGKMILPIQEPIPAVIRDPKDDYLLAYALVGAADYLVTGDKDLLVLQGKIQGLEILTPRQFAERLAAYGD